jgi:hypothetical protein
MGIPMAYNTGTTNTYTEKTVKRGTVALNPGPSLAPSYNWFNGVDITASQYLIYSDTYTTGQATQANSRPTAWTTPDLSDASLLSLINTLPERIGQTPFTYAPVALKWLHQSNRYFLIKNNFENIVTSGLILNLDASWPTSFSGTSTWFDLSPSGKNAALTNGPTLSTDNGGSVQFDGTNDYATINQTLTTPITITGFVKYNNQSQPYNMWINSYPHPVLGISLNRTGGGQIYVYIGNGSGWQGQPGIISSTNMSANTWYHLAYVSNGSSSTFYLNGVNVGSSIYSPSGWGSKYYLGWIEVATGEYLNGNIGNTQIYNRELSPAEIMQNFNAQGYRFGYSADTIVTSGLTLNLDAANGMSYPGSGTTWYDISNSGSKNGVLTNGPSFSAQTGGYFVFDGTDDAIIIPKNSVFFTNEWTWEGWINYISNSGDGSNYHGVFWAEGVMNTTTGDNGYQWLLTFRSVDTTGCYAHMRINNVSSAWGQTETNALGYPMVDRWNHVVWQFKNGNTKLYVNNVKVLDDNTRGAYGAGLGNSSDNANSRVFLGSRNDFGLESNFRMAIARHYNRMLSESEITQNYNALKGRFGL